MNDYGVLAQIVSIAGTILAAGTAMTITWVRKSKWEPLEEELGGGAKKVGGLLSSGIIALLWFYYSRNDGFLSQLALITMGICLVSLLVYQYFKGNLSFKKTIVVKGVTSEVKIIAGFKLTEYAKKAIAEKNLTIQDYYEGTAYDDDKVWTRPSKSLAKSLFTLFYILLVGSGTICLAAVSLLIAIKVNSPQG